MLSRSARKFPRQKTCAGVFTAGRTNSPQFFQDELSARPLSVQLRKTDAAPSRNSHIAACRGLIRSVVSSSGAGPMEAAPSTSKHYPEQFKFFGRGDRSPQMSFRRLFPRLFSACFVLGLLALSARAQQTPARPRLTAEVPQATTTKQTGARTKLENDLAVTPQDEADDAGDSAEAVEGFVVP